MAFDGIVISCLAWELNERLIDGRINKIYQPETDALVLTIKNNRHNYRLLLSASPSLPLAYITDGCTEFLYASSQTHQRRPDCCDHPSRYGTYFKI